MSIVLQFNFKNLYLNNDKFYNLASKTYSATLYNNPSVNVDGPKKGLKAIAFNSNIQQYMSCNPFYTTNNGLSFSFWLKADSKNINAAHIFDFGNGPSQDLVKCAIVNGNLAFIVMMNGNKYYPIQNVVENLTNNTWIHIAWTMDLSKGWNIYVNGVLKGTFTDGMYPRAMLRNYQYIGRGNSPSSPYFNGLVTDFRVYNTALSQTEVTNIFNQTYDQTPDSSDLVSDVSLNKGMTQLYNEIFCDLYKTTKGFNQCQDCTFDEQIVYKKTTESSEQSCLNTCSNEPRCTSYSYDFTKKKDNCSQFITFPNLRYKGVKNINSGYDVSKFGYKFTDLSDSQKKNVALKCSDQFLNNTFLPNKNIELVKCISQDNDDDGNFSKINVDPKCIYDLYNSNGMNPPKVNKVNYIDSPVLSISQGDETIDNRMNIYNSFLQKQIGNSNINNYLSRQSMNDPSKRVGIPETTVNPDNSDILKKIIQTGDDVVNIINIGNNGNSSSRLLRESFENQDNYNSLEYLKKNQNLLYTLLVILGILIILFIIYLKRK
jgi:hypothetical protein